MLDFKWFGGLLNIPYKRKSIESRIGKDWQGIQFIPYFHKGYINIPRENLFIRV